jgi:hypothetical protein
MTACVLSAAFLTALNAPFEQPDPADRILTYKQYAKIEHDVPYVLEFKVGNGALLMYGGRHVFDPADPQIADIQREWERFKPQAAYNEGGDPPTEKTLQRAVEHYGEAGLVRVLAQRDHVPVATFEPKRVDEARDLLKHYSPEQVKIFWVLRGFLTFRHSKSEQTADVFMKHALNDPMWKTLGAKDPATVADLDKACARLFPGLKDWRQVPDDWFDPTRSDQFTNEAQNVSGNFRDRHIFDVLVKRAQAGERVFAVIGASHVPVQEPALVAVLGKPARKRNGKVVTGP